MARITQLLRELSPKTLTFVLAAVSLDSYRRTILNDKLKEEYNNLDIIKKDLEDQKIAVETKNNLLEHKLELLKKSNSDLSLSLQAQEINIKQILENNTQHNEKFQEKYEEYLKIVNKSTSPEIKEENIRNIIRGMRYEGEMIKKNNDQILKEVQSCEDKIHSQIDLLKNKEIFNDKLTPDTNSKVSTGGTKGEGGKNGEGGININSPLEFEFKFKDFIENASATELSAIGHISLCLFIFTCLFTIVSVTYSETIIDKFKLDNKYPILVNMIKFRNEFKHIIFFFNVGLIVLALIFCIYINVSVFLISRI